jgi:hypothetical protein
VTFLANFVGRTSWKNNHAKIQCLTIQKAEFMQHISMSRIKGKCLKPQISD